MKEIWKPVVGYEGFYEVSNLGNVKSVDRIEQITMRDGSVRARKKRGKVLKQCFDGKKHYLHVNMRKNGSGEIKDVHRIVAETWIPNAFGLPEVNHKDENKTNNSVSNLEWCSRKYNNNYGAKLCGARGEKNPQNKFSQATIERIRREYTPNDPRCGITPLAKKYGMSASHCRSIIKGHRWGWLQ